MAQLTKALAVLRGWGSGLLDLFYPPHCVACGRMGAWLCAACREQIAFLRPPVCAHCGRRLAGPGICAECHRSSSALAALRSVAEHRPPLREAVHALKYEGLRALAEPCGELLAQKWREEPWPAQVIVPVPLHPRRLRQRGYNQALLLARALGRKIALPVRPELLLRQRDTRAQVGLNRQERRENVAGAFRCAPGGAQGLTILLVDDVLTTGATLEACAEALVQGGAAQVWALTLTRAVDDGADVRLVKGYGR